VANVTHVLNDMWTARVRGVSFFAAGAPARRSHGPAREAHARAGTSHRHSAVATGGQRRESREAL